MKRLLFIACIATLFVACIDHGSKTGTATGNDSTGQKGHDDHSTAGKRDAPEKSMMLLMTAMMDSMKGIRSTGDKDNDFAALMKAHHVGAIEMAKVELAQGSDPDIRAMAQGMIDDQQREVDSFDKFLSASTPQRGSDAFFQDAMSSMEGMKMNMDHGAGLDKQFVQMMIPHHQSAVDMAEAYLKSGTQEAELKSVASGIVTSQQKEIKALQAWLDKTR